MNTVNEYARLRDAYDLLKEENRQLRDLLAAPKVRIPLEWELSPQRARLFRCLVTHEIMSRDMAMSALYFDRPGPPPDPVSVNQLMYALRKQLKPHGVVIRNAYGIGWQLQNRRAYLDGVAG